MKKSRIVFACSIILFLVSWGIKANIPVERPDNIEISSQEVWYEKDYSHIYGNDEWYLATADPKNYVKVDGYESIYQCKNIDGTIVYFMKKTDEKGNVTYIEISDFVP